MAYGYGKYFDRRDTICKILIRQVVIETMETFAYLYPLVRVSVGVL